MTEQFLVLGRCYMDDIPLAIYPTLEEAQRYCDGCVENVESLLAELRARGDDLQLDPSDLVCLDVFRMKGHTSIQNVLHYDDDQLGLKN